MLLLDGIWSKSVREKDDMAGDKKDVEFGEGHMQVKDKKKKRKTKQKNNQTPMRQDHTVSKLLIMWLRMNMCMYCSNTVVFWKLP